MTSIFAAIASLLFHANPSRNHIFIPKSGFSTLDKPAQNCRIAQQDSEIITGTAGEQRIHVKNCPDWYANNLSIGFSPRNHNTPYRGIRFQAKTHGAIFYRENFSFNFRTDLPWLLDVDSDGNSEIIIWESRWETNYGRLSAPGVIPWTYKLKKDKLEIDSISTCISIGALILVHYQTLEELQLMSPTERPSKTGHEEVIAFLHATKSRFCGAKQ